MILLIMLGVMAILGIIYFATKKVKYPKEGRGNAEPIPEPDKKKGNEHGKEPREPQIK